MGTRRARDERRAARAERPPLTLFMGLHASRSCSPSTTWSNGAGGDDHGRADARCARPPTSRLLITGSWLAAGPKAAEACGNEPTRSCARRRDRQPGREREWTAPRRRGAADAPSHLWTRDAEAHGGLRVRTRANEPSETAQPDPGERAAPTPRSAQPRPRASARPVSARRVTHATQCARERRRCGTWAQSARHASHRRANGPSAWPHSIVADCSHTAGWMWTMVALDSLGTHQPL
jgi:hypothetical protein